MVIYKITNLINNKIYIGQTINDRKSYMGSGRLIREAIKKYGNENFKKEILLKVDTIEELNEAEIRFIQEYDSTNCDIGYNLNEGGQFESRTGTTLHEETKRKISKSLKGFKHTEETRKKMSINSSGENNGMYGKGYKVSGEKNGRYGKSVSNKTRKKISESRKGKIASEETRKKISKKSSGENNGMYGNNQYNIWLERYGKQIADKKYKEWKSKISKSQKGKTMSEEHKEKIRQARIKYWKNKKNT